MIPLDLFGAGGGQAWRLRAACRGLDPDLFHPEQGDSMAPAKAVCRRCEVREECLSYALENVERNGVWGGLSENERKRLRRLQLGNRTCPWCRASFTPAHPAQHYCQPEHAAAASSARKASSRRAG